MAKIICIDARLWGVRHTGIGRYTEELINRLTAEPKIRIILIVPSELRKEPKLKRFEKYYLDDHPYSLLGQFRILKILGKIKPDLLHVPHFTIPIFWRGRMIVTIHDLIKHYSVGPDASTHSPIVYWFKYFGYLLVVWLAVKRANHIIVPANYWKNILIEKYKLNPVKISVTYEGVSKSFSGEQLNSLPAGKAGLTGKQLVSKPYLIYVGNLYPHKNIPVLLRAIKLLDGKVSLIIVCARDVFRQRLEIEIEKEEISKFVEFLGYVSDSELAKLYKNALAFVTPSLIEGFGLPGLEAMAAGTPVIAARASCLPEIYDESALFFNPFDPKDLKDKIESVIYSEKKREKYIKKGLEQVKKYSWPQMATQTFEIYKKMS